MAVRLADKIKQSNDANFFLVDAADVEMADGTSLQTKIASIEAGASLNISIVDELPTTNISTSTIYLVPNDSTDETNIYDEHIYVNRQWETIGSTAIDISNYYTKDEVGTLVDTKIANAKSPATVSEIGLVKPDGDTITVDDNGTLSVAGGAAGSELKYSLAIKSTGDIVGLPEFPEDVKGKPYLILRGRGSYDNYYYLFAAQNENADVIFNLAGYDGGNGYVLIECRNKSVVGESEIPNHGDDYKTITIYQFNSNDQFIWSKFKTISSNYRWANDIKVDCANLNFSSNDTNNGSSLAELFAYGSVKTYISKYVLNPSPHYVILHESEPTHDLNNPGLETGDGIILNNQIQYFYTAGLDTTITNATYNFKPFVGTVRPDAYYRAACKNNVVEITEEGLNNDYDPVADTRFKGYYETKEELDTVVSSVGDYAYIEDNENSNYDQYIKGNPSFILEDEAENIGSTNYYYDAYSWYSPNVAYAIYNGELYQAASSDKYLYYNYAYNSFLYKFNAENRTWQFISTESSSSGSDSVHIGFGKNEIFIHHRPGSGAGSYYTYWLNSKAVDENGLGESKQLVSSTSGYSTGYVNKPFIIGDTSYFSNGYKVEDNTKTTMSNIPSYTFLGEINGEGYFSYNSKIYKWSEQYPTLAEACSQTFPVTPSQVQPFLSVNGVILTYYNDHIFIFDGETIEQVANDGIFNSSHTYYAIVNDPTKVYDKTAGKVQEIGYGSWTKGRSIHKVNVDLSQYYTKSEIDTLLDGTKIWTGTQAQYDALTTKDPNTLYFIKEE